MRGFTTANISAPWLNIHLLDSYAMWTGRRGRPKTKEELDAEMDDYFLKGDEKTAQKKLNDDLDEYVCCLGPLVIVNSNW